MKKHIYIVLVLIIPLSNLTLNAQIQSSIISRAISLNEKGEYEQTISLLLNAEYMFHESDSTDFNILYHLHLGNAYLQTQMYDKAEIHLLNCFTRIEKKYGKYSKEYSLYYHLLIQVYNLSYNYEKLISSTLNFLDVIKNVYGTDNPAYSEHLYTLGNLYLQLSQYDLAEKYLLQALEVREKNLGKEHIDYIVTYTSVGSLYETIGDYEKARAIFEDIVNYIKHVFFENKDEDFRNNKSVQRFYTAALARLGNIELQMGNVELSESYLLEAKQIIEKNKQEKSDVYVSILSAMGQLSIAKNQYSLAETYLIDAKNLHLQLNDTVKAEMYSRIIGDLATVYNSIGNYKSAESLYLESLQILQETTGKKTWYITIMNNLGVMYINIGNFEKGRDVLIEAKNIQEEILGTNNPLYAITLANLGILYLDNEDLQLAEQYLLQSKEIYERQNHQSPQYGELLNNLGVLNFKMGNSQLAFDYLIKSKELKAKMSGEDSPDYALSLHNLSTILYQSGNDSLAIDLAESAALNFKENFGEKHPHYILALNTIGLIYSNIGLYKEAEEALFASNELYIQAFGKNHSDRIFPLNNLSALYKKQGKYDLALTYILEAKELLETSDKGEKAILHNIYWIYWALEKYDLAFQCMIEWSDYIKQKTTQNFSFMSAKQRKSFWEQNDGNGLGYATKNILKVLLTRETQSLAFDNTLFSKGILLRSSNEIRDAILTSDNQELLEKFVELQSHRQQIIALESKTDSALLAYKQTLEEQVEQLDKEVTLASVDYRNMKADLNMNWQDVQKNLNENEVAIEFVSFDIYNKQWTDSVMYAALLIRKDSKSPEYIPLFEKSQLSVLLHDENPEVSKRIQKLYNGSNPRFYNGQKLYNLIWEPLESYLEGVETVYYSPSGLLNRISFAAIPVDTILLNDKYNLHLLSSTREILKLKKEGYSFLPLQQAVTYGGIMYDIEDSEVLVESAQKYHTEKTQYIASRSLPNDSTRSGWTYLNGTEKEVIEIDHILQKSKVPNIKYMGISANEESFKNLSGNAPELLHIATHGFFLEDEKEIRETGFMQMVNTQNRRYVNPLLRSGLLFAGANRAWKNENVISDIEDGILTAEEISQLNLSNTKLVVLSACETGLGEVQNIEGVFGLQRAFKLAGIETLVMSLWKVDDVTTNDFMTVFYQNLLSGKTKLQSFKIAQQTVRSQHPNPYYWAAFVMMD